MNRFQTWGLLAGVLLCPLFAYAQEVNQPRLINVTGTADQKVSPDEVVLRLGVETRNKDLSAAKVETDAIVKKVIAEAKSRGITEENLQSSELNMEPVYEDNDKGKKVQFFELRRSIDITLTDVSKFEDLLTAVLQAGVTGVDATDFRVKEARKYKEQVRALAIQAAHEKAAAIAQQLNARLSRVHSVSELSEGLYFSYGKNANAYAYAFSTASSQGESSFVLGKVTVSASVGISYEIE